MKAKLRAIWMVLTSSSFWLVTKNKTTLNRQYKNFTVEDAMTVAEDVSAVVTRQLECDSAVKEAAKIANGLCD
jgi:hypothetical protein